MVKGEGACAGWPQPQAVAADCRGLAV